MSICIQIANEHSFYKQWTCASAVKQFFEILDKQHLRKGCACMGYIYKLNY